MRTSPLLSLTCFSPHSSLLDCSGGFAFWNLLWPSLFLLNEIRHLESVLGVVRVSVSKRKAKKKRGGKSVFLFNTRGLLVHKWLLYSTPALETIIANPHCCLLLTCRVSLQLGVAVLGQGRGERGATWLTQQLKGSPSTPPPRYGDNAGREARWMYSRQQRGPVFPEGALCRQRETESRNVNCLWYVPFRPWISPYQQVAS